MRGFGIVIGYILGNETARKWCWGQICKASCVIDKELKKATNKGKKNAQD